MWYVCMENFPFPTAPAQPRDFLANTAFSDDFNSSCFLQIRNEAQVKFALLLNIQTTV